MAKKNLSGNSPESALFGFGRVHRRENRPVRLQILWSRVFLAGFVLFVAAWFATAGVLFYFFKHRHGYEEVKYSKMLVLPFRLDDHRKEMGDFHVEKGLESLRQGDLRPALHLLRTGVARSKSNSEGRMALAQIFHSGLQRPDLAADILEEGLRYSDENPNFLKVEYLQPLFRLLLNNQYDARVTELSDQVLPRLIEGSDEFITIVFATAQANIFRGNYSEAERILEQFNLLGSPQGQILLAQIRWNRGLEDRAIAILHQALSRFPARDDLYSTLMRYYREQESWELVRRYSALRSIRFPEKAGPMIDRLYALDATGEDELINEGANEIFNRFPPNESAILLAQFGASTGRTDIARIAYDKAIESDLGIGPFALLLLESLIRAGDYEIALQFSNQLREDRPDWLIPYQSLENAFRSLAMYGLGRELDAEIFVREFLKSDRTRSQTHIAVANLFSSVGSPEIANQILVEGYSRNSGNQPLLSSLVLNEIQLNDDRDFVRRLRDLLRMRVPDEEVLSLAYQELGSDDYLFLKDREQLLSRIEELIVNPG